MNFATLDLNLLRVLDALFREGSTVKAADRLAMSQSAVSGALSRLRYALDDPLFVRQGNRLVATDYAAGIETGSPSSMFLLRGSEAISSHLNRTSCGTASLPAQTIAF